jgi:iron complex transport system ATP-binding protein
MSAVLLSTKSLGIKAGSKLLCSGLDLCVSAGEFWCIVGRNGAGKSTLLHTLAGLITPTEGHVFVNGTDIRALKADALARQRGLLAQQQFDAFSSSVLETVIAGRHPYQMGLGWPNGEDSALARRALAAVGLADCAYKDVTRLSGGERQRVGLATLLTQDPDLLLLDEPTAHQDAASQLAVMRLLQAIIAEQSSKAVIAACHDINLVSRFATHVLVLADGRHWQGRADEVLLPSILQQAFGCSFDVVETGHGRFFVPLGA